MAAEQPRALPCRPPLLRLLGGELPSRGPGLRLSPVTVHRHLAEKIKLIILFSFPSTVRSSVASIYSQSKSWKETQVSLKGSFELGSLELIHKREEDQIPRFWEGCAEVSLLVSSVRAKLPGTGTSCSSRLCQHHRVPSTGACNQSLLFRCCMGTPSAPSKSC